MDFPDDQRFPPTPISVGPTRHEQEQVPGRRLTRGHPPVCSMGAAASTRPQPRLKRLRETVQRPVRLPPGAERPGSAGRCRDARPARARCGARAHRVCAGPRPVGRRSVECARRLRQRGPSARLAGGDGGVGRMAGEVAIHPKPSVGTSAKDQRDLQAEHWRQCAEIGRLFRLTGLWRPSSWRLRPPAAIAGKKRALSDWTRLPFGG